MADLIETIVRDNYSLSYTPHGTEGKCRVNRNDFDGALWITPKDDFTVFDIETTGQIENNLNSFLVRRFGRHVSENASGYRLWRVNGQSELSEVIVQVNNL